MRINNNLMAMNTHRQLGIGSTNASRSMEKLSSGMRINRAGDDAAGLAISEKMRGQIRGLNMASRNAQDGISMVQTAEGALQETQAILQRMRELAVQASNGTNEDADRGALQNEISQLKSEIDRIAETTEFNKQSLLQGDGGVNIKSSGLFNTAVAKTGADAVHTNATADITFSNAGPVAGDDFSIDLNGQTIAIDYATDSDVTTDDAVYSGNASANAATVSINGTGHTVAETADATAEAIQAVIDANDQLKGNYTAVSDGVSKVTIKAVSGGAYEGSLGNISNFVETSYTTGANITETLTGAVGDTVSPTAATYNLDFSSATGLSIDTKEEVKNLIGKGFTINGQEVEFYNANEGEYTGDAIGINISDALSESVTANWDDALANAIAPQLNKLEGVTAAVTGPATGIIKIDSTATGASAKLGITDGATVNKEFSTEFQIGANNGQTMGITINDMRAAALGVDSVDISTANGAKSAIDTIESALTSVSDERAKLGAFQNRLEHSIKNLDTSSENLQAAESRIRDVDMAKEMMEFTKNNILQQAAQAMLAQAQQIPQGVLQLLR